MSPALAIKYANAAAAAHMLARATVSKKLNLGLSLFSTRISLFMKNNTNHSIIHLGKWQDYDNTTTLKLRNLTYVNAVGIGKSGVYFKNILRRHLRAECLRKRSGL